MRRSNIRGLWISAGVLAAAYGVYASVTHGKAKSIAENFGKADAIATSPVQPGRYRLAFALSSIEGKPLSMPSGVCLGLDNDLFLSDSNTCRIYHLTTAGKLISSFGGFGQAPGQFDGPNGISVARDGTLLVADTGNNRLQRLTADGKSVSIIRARMVRPTSVAQDSHGIIYVASRQGNNVDKYSATGEWLGKVTDETIDGEVATSPDDRIFTLQTLACRNMIAQYDKSGRKTEEFGGNARPFNHWELLYMPSGIKVTANAIYVNRYGDGAVNVYDRDGRYVQSVIEEIRPHNRFEAPGPVALDVDGQGNLYVCAQGCHSLEKVVLQKPDDGRLRSAVATN